MHPKIQVHHRQRLAFVYVRQSSPGQVRRHVESGERQRRMQEHVRQLGWPEAQVRVLGGDTGISASSQHGRDDFQALLAAVFERSAGIVAAAELSRLARDNQDWGQLVRLCRFHDVLLADEHRVYDPSDPQDRVLLGIQGAFQEYELAMLTDRMLQCRRQKAARGELYEGFPPGYVCRKPPLQEKHPDDRVQRAVQKVFDDFDRQPSVYALFQQLQAERFEMPLVRNTDWREVVWQSPSYDALLGLLRNPIYAGIYVRGRRQTVRELDEHGHTRRRERRVPQAEWEVFLPDHHAAYITRERWERNMRKITDNASRPRDAVRSPGKGASLLAGLVRCRRCGRRLHVSYAQGVRYVCRGGRTRRAEPTVAGGCFSFAGTELEQQVEELLLEVVSPAGVAAAERAAEQLAAGRSRQRQVLADRVAAAREAERRAAREYKSTDETYLSVRQKLAAEWDAALQMQQQAESRLQAFDATEPASLTAAERESLRGLGGSLSRVWHSPQSDGVLKKQLVRTLITEIVVDVDEARDELQFWVHWSGGRHTEHRASRRRRRGPASSDLVSIVSTLRKILADDGIATALNRVGLTTSQGASWTSDRVKSFRRQHAVPAHSAAEREREGWLTQSEAATRLSVSPMSVHRLIRSGQLPAEQPGAGLPTVVLAASLTLEGVEHAVRTLKSRTGGPLPADRNQQTLFPLTN